MIAKTGTLGEGSVASQAWFIGAIPQYSMAVGMFTDKPNGVHKQILDGLPYVGGVGGSFGGAWPATIWRKFMGDQFDNLPVKALPPPGYTGANPLFTKWVMAPKIKPKPKKCKLPGHGHHHHFFFGGGGNGNGKNCKGGPNPNPSPNPPPSGGPSPNPTPSGFPTPPFPTPTPTPTPTPSPTPTTSSGPSPAPQIPRRAADLASYSAYVVPSSELLRQLGRMTTSGQPF